MLLNTIMIYGLGAQTNSSLLPQDAVSSNLRKSGLKKPVVASSLKRQGKFPCPRTGGNHLKEGKNSKSKETLERNIPQGMLR